MVLCAHKSRKSEIREFGKRLIVVKSQNIEGLFKLRVTSFTHDTLRRSVAIKPTDVQRKWSKYLPVRVLQRLDCLLQ